MRRAALAVSAVVLLAAVGGFYAWSELVPGPPDAIAILPAEGVTLTPTASQRFAAQVRDIRGRLIDVRPSWTSDGGAVDADGRFTAPDRAGTYFVEAAVGTVTALTRVTVSPGAPRTVRVTPADATVKPRDTVPLSATALDEWGNLVPVTPAWRVTHGTGTVDQQGIFRAGTSGTSTIAAEIEGLVASATVAAACVPPRTETAADLAFTVVCGTFADVWLNGPGLDPPRVVETIDRAVVAVEGAFGRSLGHRLNVNVFSTKESFDRGLRQLFRVEPSPLEEGVYVPPSLIGINWTAPDSPEAIARHEITHLMVDAVAGRRSVPYWLHEGLATLNEFPIAEDTALISRYCTASAAQNGRLPDLAALASAQGWRAYVNEVGVVAYFVSAQVASFVADDARGQVSLLEKMAGGLPMESAYAAASGRPFDAFVAELGERARGLADGYPGVAVTRRLADGSVVYVAYGEPGDSRITIDIRNDRFFGGGTATTTFYGCYAGSIDSRWPQGTYVVTLDGAAGRATATLRR
jgi:hypothetical protein